MNEQTSATRESIPFASLPPLKQPLDGGIFCGLITLADGKHYAVVKLDAKAGKRMNWEAAMKWAKKAGGDLPHRAVASMMFSVASDLFELGYHWTRDTDGSSLAWCVASGTEIMYCSYEGAEFRAVAVRLIPLAY